MEIFFIIIIVFLYPPHHPTPNHLRLMCSLRQTWPTAEYITVIHGALVYMRRQIDSSSHFLSWRKCHLWGLAMMNAIMWLVHRLGGVHFHLNVWVCTHAHARTHTYTHTHPHTLACTQKVERQDFVHWFPSTFPRWVSSKGLKQIQKQAFRVVAWLAKGSDTTTSWLVYWFTCLPASNMHVSYASCVRIYRHVSCLIASSQWGSVVVCSVEPLPCLRSDDAVVHDLHDHLHDAIWPPNWLFDFPANMDKLFFIHACISIASSRVIYFLMALIFYIFYILFPLVALRSTRSHSALYDYWAPKNIDQHI